MPKDAHLGRSPCRNPGIQGNLVIHRYLVDYRWWKTKQRNTKMRLMAVEAEPGKLPVA